MTEVGIFVPASWLPYLLCGYDAGMSPGKLAHIRRWIDGVTGLNSTIAGSFRANCADGEVGLLMRFNAKGVNATVEERARSLG